MPGTAAARKGNRIVTALAARTQFGKLLDGMEKRDGSVVISKRGTPKAVLLSIGDYLKLAAPEPEVLRIIGEEAERNGTSRLTSRQIDTIIKKARAENRKG